MQIKDRRIDELTADPANVRKHNHKNLEAIIGSLRRFGQQKPIVVDQNGVVRAGNGTLAAAQHLGWETIRVVETTLTGSEATAYAIADNRTAELAEWDTEALAKTLEQLKFADEIDLEDLGFDQEDYDALLDWEYEEDEEGSDREYTGKIEAPVYEPTMEEPPPVSELCDVEKSETLKESIRAADIPEDVRKFLLMAADRHRKFDYEKIAEFYAHADEVTQDLMERSALVIIDFNKAVENGFMKLTKSIAEAFADEQPTE